MKTKDYIPYDDTGKVLWLSNFSEELPNYATELGITPAQLSQVQTDGEFFGGFYTYLMNQKNVFEALTAYKNQLRNGKLPLGSIPTFATPPTAPAAALNDVFGRIRQLVRAIKANPNYTEAIGDALKIIGSESEDNPDTWKPVLKAEMKAGSPDIKWTKGQSSGIKLWVDRGNGQGFTFLAIDTIPDFLDTHPLPPQGQSALWKYQAIYILKDEEVGQMSDVLEVSIKGRVT